MTVKQKEALILSKGMRSVNDKMVDCIEIKAFYAIININADVVESAVCNPTKKDPWFIKTPITPRKKPQVNPIYSLV